MADPNLIISGVSLSSIISAVVLLIRIFNQNKTTTEESVTVKLQIISAVNQVEQKISQQNGSLLAINTELKGFNERCKLHIDNQDKINSGIEKRICSAEEKLFKIKGG